jgi:hypothetical protein
MEKSKYPLANFLRGLLSFVYYFIIVCAVLALIAFVAFLVNPDLETWNSFNHFGFLYNLSPLNESLTLKITESPPMVDDPELELLGAVRFKLSNRGWVLLYFFSMYFFIFMSLYIINQLRKFLRAVGSGDFFIKDNVARIRKIGYVTIFLSVVDAVGTLITSKFLTPISIEYVPVSLFWEGTFNIFQRHLHGIFMGLVIIAIAEIFRFGARLSEEHELTV